MTGSYTYILHVLVTVAALLTYVLASHALPRRRHPSAAIGWVLFILLLPYAALPLYLMFGTRKLPHARHAQSAPRVAKEQPVAAGWLAQASAALEQPPAVAYRDLRVHADGGAALAALLEIIDGARHSLDVCTFLLGRDAVGAKIGEHLAGRARAGVRVRLLLDGIGRWMGGGADLSGLEKAGVQVAFFVPSLSAPLKGHLNLRNHRKLAAADAGHPGERLWCGGRNLAADYFEGRDGDEEGEGWRDLTFDAQGPLARQAAELFQKDWAFSQGEASPAQESPARRFGEAAGAAGEAAGALGESAGALGESARALGESARALGESARAEGESAGAPLAQIVASGPDQADDTVHVLLVSAAFHAKRRIALVSPYVVLDDALLLALCMAARRGVTVDLLLPARSNHRIADFARHRSLRALADAGVRVWLAPRMMHAKAAIIDESPALAGSANLDSRSLLLNYELMIAFHAAADVAQFAAWFEHERASASRYVPQRPRLLRDIAEGLMLWVCFQI